jgi:hypothetical protein
LKLTLAERVAVVQIIRAIQNAPIPEWNIIDNIIEALGLKEADNEKFGITTEETPAGAIMRWNNKDAAIEELPYPLTTAQYELIKRELRKRESRLARNEVSLAKKLLS